MKKKIGLAIVVILCAGLIVAGYYFLSNRENASAEEKVELTEVQKINMENLDKDYPATPREVVKFYNRIISCYYSENYTDEELEEMADQARKLFDEELLENNPKEQYMEELRADIADYRERSKNIMSSSVCSTNDVKLQNVDGDECAYVTASYFIKEKKAYSKTFQMYVLRKDEDGNWKILVFYQIEGENLDE